MNITISNGNLQATINPQGAELNSLKNASGREYIWEGNPEFWGKHSPVLFPIVGTLKNNSYIHKGKVYQMTRHGFARDNVFAIKASDENSVTFSLASNEKTREAYPFDFELEIKYHLNNDTLAIDYNVTNYGNENMPFSLGAHPAFALPRDFSSYSLKFEKDEELLSTQLENDLLSDKIVKLPVHDAVLPLSYELFERDALILKKHNSGHLDILEDNIPLLRVSYNDFPHLGIWTKQNAPFICIEPWQGYSDTLNASGNLDEKEGILLLKPKEHYKAGFEIQILR